MIGNKILKAKILYILTPVKGKIFFKRAKVKLIAYIFIVNFIKPQRTQVDVITQGQLLQ